MKPLTPCRRSRPRASTATLTALAALAALAGAAILLPASAEAACVCRCVDGKAQPVCSSGTDIPPLCNTTSCPMTPPRVSPMDAAKPKPDVKPGCTVKQVYDPKAGKYEWAQICN
jgi:hypothetical protein